MATDELCKTCCETGYICEDCRQPDGACECVDGPELVPCPDCSDEIPTAKGGQ